MTEFYCILLVAGAIQFLILEILRRTGTEDSQSLTGILNQVEREIKEQKEGGAK